MTAVLQGSLFDSATHVHPTLRAVGDGMNRIHLDARSWVDVRPEWLAAPDVLFEHLADHVPWRAERRHMYDRMVDVPRLTCFYGAADPLPHPVLETAREMLSRHYADELGESFVTAGLCYYRDGADSVAWHGDRIGRSRLEDTMVAILSVGQPRTLALRPNGGRTAYRLGLGHGDLVVMGGACQREWEHCVPKTADAVGPRISIQFRPAGVR
ncbi:MAG TPA: alpha-ketoglutarate-dependent dioxygenase AlkB [Intrasporangiaceae bacterium]|nr:alpha-ketoglutarate-dependent dioxygenase AlkB [Intrasporangiaceae bacterium]